MFLHALDVSRQQKARGWELQAAMSLARLWQTDGRDARETARERVLHSFTEGFATRDLRAADALLSVLR